MIASLRGAVAHVGLDHLIIEVGGMGFKVHTTPATASAFTAGGQALLHTSLVVREESWTLYGFADADGQALFEQVQTVSGVGPRLAQAMLAVHAPDDVRRAISRADLVALTKVPGIGRKGAERIVLELRDKVAPTSSGGAEASASDGGGSNAGNSDADQVVQALVGLGWNTKQAEEAVRSASKVNGDGEASTGLTVAALLRAALRELGR